MKSAQRNCTCDGRCVEKSIDFQPRLRGSHSSGTFGPTLKYPSILLFSPSNPEPRSPTESSDLVRWVGFADRPTVLEPRDVSRYLFTAQPALEDDWFVFEHCDVVIKTDFELGYCAWTNTHTHTKKKRYWLMRRNRTSNTRLQLN